MSLEPQIMEEKEEFWKNEKLDKLKSEHVRLCDLDFSGKSITACIFRDVEFERCKFDGAMIRTSFFEFCKFRSSSFSHVDMRFCSLSGSIFDRVSFVDSDVINVSFAGNTIKMSDFSNSDLSSSHFFKVILERVKFENCKLDSTFFLTTSSSNNISFRLANTPFIFANQEDVNTSHLKKIHLYHTKIKINSYFLACSKEGFIIDPADISEQFVEKIEGEKIDLKKVLLTNPLHPQILRGKGSLAKVYHFDEFSYDVVDHREILPTRVYNNGNFYIDAHPIRLMGKNICMYKIGGALFVGLPFLDCFMLPKKPSFLEKIGINRLKDFLCSTSESTLCFPLAGPPFTIKAFKFYANLKTL